MIHPTPSELLARIADALTESVLPELEQEDARIQLQVAALVLRRLAGLAGDIVPYLDADSRDMASTINDLLPALSLPDATAADARVLVGDTLASEPVAATAEFVARNEALQALLVEVHHAVHDLPPGDDTRQRLDGEIHALITRMLARERAIHTTYSNW